MPGFVAEFTSRAGFRAWAFASPASRWLAAIEVAGHVRNLPDGQVELVAEGEPIELDRFLAAIQLEMGTYIRNVAGGNRIAGQ